MSRNFGLKAHELDDEVWSQYHPEAKLWAYAVFGVAFVAIVAVAMLGG